MYSFDPSYAKVSLTDRLAFQVAVVAAYGWSTTPSYSSFNIITLDPIKSMTLLKNDLRMTQIFELRTNLISFNECPKMFSHNDLSTNKNLTLIQSEILIQIEKIAFWFDFLSILISYGPIDNKKYFLDTISEYDYKEVNQQAMIKKNVILPNVDLAPFCTNLSEFRKF
ncbi:hypothetical protein BpHYR1_029915 [Brachionus plicatilis]|uniref:Uncharacterized protein n=1 Tax=Brachionus plicatilis TaxID=10195 RepID=A0A3M7SVP2_BRAPC|nr:hypothetical protein BpHYR1_029915 [Brachionus plicatilis]